MYAYREAIAHYEAALDLLEADEPGERAELLASLGHAAYPLVDFSRCARYWREAQRLYEQLGDRLKVAELARWLGRIAWESDDPQSAFEQTRAAIEILEAEPPGHELAMAYSALSQLYMVSSRADESIAWGEKALRLA
jgi:tetratricopeptide (TPR) repeat protein